MLTFPRKRRVKCAEQKPSCAQCIKTGRECDGYTESASWSNRIKGVRTAVSVVPPRPIRSPSALFAGTPEELEGFEAFRVKTVPDLCGLFSSEFWSRGILQTCQHEPAIRHAAIALGALHGRVKKDGVVEDWDNEFAVRQYLKAISCMTRPDRTQTIDVALMTCLLFTAFEVSLLLILTP